MGAPRIFAEGWNLSVRFCRILFSLRLFAHCLQKSLAHPLSIVTCLFCHVWLRWARGLRLRERLTSRPPRVSPAPAHRR